MYYDSRRCMSNPYKSKMCTGGYAQGIQRVNIILTPGDLEYKKKHCSGKAPVYRLLKF